MCGNRSGVFAWRARGCKVWRTQSKLQKTNGTCSRALSTDERHENRHIEVDGIGDDLLSETQVS
jgi:hypothetical protein